MIGSMKAASWLNSPARLIAVALGVGLALVCAVAFVWILPSSTTEAVHPSAREQVLPLLAQDHFADLETLLDGVQAAFERGVAGEADVERAYNGFRTSDPTVTAQLDRWIEAHPQARSARVARAIHRQHLSHLLVTLDGHARRQAAVTERILRLQMQIRQDLAEALFNRSDLMVGIAAAFEEAAGGRRLLEIDAIFDGLKEQDKHYGLVYKAHARNLNPWETSESASWEQAMERLEEFLRDTERAFGDDPDFTWLTGYYDSVQGEIARRREDLAGSVAAYTRAIAASERPEYRLGRGISHALSGDHANAIADFDRAIALDATYADAYCQRGLQRRLLGQIEESLADMNQAVLLDPLNPEYVVSRASVLTLLGWEDEARTDVTQATIYGGHYPWVQMWRAELFRDVDPAVSQEAYSLSVSLADAQGDGITYPTR
jgi:tetratricopeptide (TPR) repeat protein